MLVEFWMPMQWQTCYAFKRETEKNNSRFWDRDSLLPAFWSETFSVFRLTDATRRNVICWKTRNEIYEHVIKRLVVTLIPLKLHPKCFWKKENLVKLKKNNHNDIFRVRAVFTWLSKGIGFGFGFTTPFGWLVYLLWFWFYDSQVKTALFMS